MLQSKAGDPQQAITWVSKVKPARSQKYPTDEKLRNLDPSTQ